MRMQFRKIDNYGSWGLSYIIAKKLVFLILLLKKDIVLEKGVYFIIL